MPVVSVATNEVHAAGSATGLVFDTPGTGGDDETDVAIVGKANRECLALATG